MMVSECYGSEQESQRGASDNAVALYATYIYPVSGVNAHERAKNITCPTSVCTA